MTDPLDRIYERVLVLRCQAGDEAAFAELVGRYAPRLRYYLRRLLDGEPDDVMQEVWRAVARSCTDIHTRKSSLCRKAPQRSLPGTRRSR